MLLVTTWFGSFLCDGEKVVNYRLFPKDSAEIADRLGVIDNDGILGEEIELLSSCGYSTAVGEKRLAQYGFFSDERVEIRPGDYGFSADLLHRALMALGKRKSKAKPTSDFHIIQALRTVDSLAESANLLSERVRDWYSVHFPELERLTTDEKYVSLIAKSRDRMEIASLIKFDGDSIGSPIENEDAESVRAVALAAVAANEARARLERYIGKRMKEVAPNITHLIGPIIGARLIAHAGGLGRLASKPSSTIQLLGAENALFRHLKTGAKPPKYGIIFQHPSVHGAPRHARGKVARSLSGVISIAAKVDYNKGTFIGDDLKKKLDIRVRSVMGSERKKKEKK